jgi:succinate dehydrogenase / fumarate reductase, cytochrome b subunit
MCVEANPRTKQRTGGCCCGGHGHARRKPEAAARDIVELDLSAPAKHRCNCDKRRCPRTYLAWSGLVLGGFLVLHFGANLLGFWPATFQAFVSRNHALGWGLTALEVTLIFVPLAVHLKFGLRTLQREQLRYGIEKHHHGSDLRQWLQRVTAVILLAFLVFHIATMHRWLGGRFAPDAAFTSASQAIWQFWRGLPVGHPANLLVATFYLLGIVAAVYHFANGVATAAEVLGWVETPVAQRRLGRACLLAGAALLLIGMVAWYALSLNGN